MTEVLRAIGEAEPLPTTSGPGSVFHQSRRPHLRADQSPGNGQGALFARYSRSGKSLRRLFLDEFATRSRRRRRPPRRTSRQQSRAPSGSTRVFSDYGDDSVAQLGGAHIACEYARTSHQVLEWGADAVFEQSTRYVPHTDRRNGTLALPRAGGDRQRRPSRSATSAPWTRPSPLRGLDSADAGVFRGLPSVPAPTWRRFTARRSGPRRSTRCAACRRPRRSRTSASTAAARPSILLGCAPIR